MESYTVGRKLGWASENVQSYLCLEVLLVFTGKSRGDAGASLSETHSISVSGSLQSKCLRRINDTRTITDFVESCDSCEIKYENLISALLNLSSLP